MTPDEARFVLFAWRRERKLRAVLKRKETLILRGYDGNYSTMPQIKMHITPWFNDEHGMPTRLVRALG
jgi:hypothetical protein